MLKHVGCCFKNMHSNGARLPPALTKLFPVLFKPAHLTSLLLPASPPLSSVMLDQPVMSAAAPFSSCTLRAFFPGNSLACMQQPGVYSQHAGHRSRLDDLLPSWRQHRSAVQCAPSSIGLRYASSTRADTGQGRNTQEKKPFPAWLQIIRRKRQ